MIITHGNVVSNLAGWCLHENGERGTPEEREREREREEKYDAGINFSTFQESNFTMTNEEVYISYLPLAHMMERVLQAMVLQSGGRIGFYCSGIKLLIEDIQALRPMDLVLVCTETAQQNS